MTAHRHRRQVVLFVIAVVFPSLVLAGLTGLAIHQERELAKKRHLEEKQRRVREWADELWLSLESIRGEESRERRESESVHVEPFIPGVVLVARLQEDRLRLPWELVARNQSSYFIGGEAFISSIHNGETEEFGLGATDRAERAYREALKHAGSSSQAAYARLSLARVLASGERKHEARVQYRELLGLSSDVRDEYGIPFCFYAADRLLELGEERSTVFERIKGEADNRSVSPEARYLLRGIAKTLMPPVAADGVIEGTRELLKKTKRNIDLVNQAKALKRDFSDLCAVARSGRRGGRGPYAWMPYGEEPWLVNVPTSRTLSVNWVLAVDADTVCSSLAVADSRIGESSSRLRLVTDEREGEPLGDRFPGLFVTGVGIVPEKMQSSGLARLYLAILILVLSTTLFGAYLLWRDVRRELRLAELRSQFVSSVSHELKTPLTGIRMFAETLRLRPSQGPEIREEYLETIVNETERLSRLLNNVLDFSKIEQGTKLYRLQSTSLSEVLDAAVRAMRYPLQQQGFTLHVKADHDLPPAEVDRDALEQAILNLLTNAMKYSDEKREINLVLTRICDEALIQVSDQGVGISLPHQRRIFDKFYRVPDPDQQSIPGTGLGLALVEHIVNAHHGRVEVKSSPGEGSTFSIFLPLERQS